MHFCCSHYISSCFLSTPPFILSLSCFLFLSLSLSFSLSLFISAPSFSLWLQDTCHLMPFTKYSLLDQSYFFTPYLSIAHIKFTNYSPTIFYDYHPQSCLKNIFFALGPTVVYFFCFVGLWSIVFSLIAEAAIGLCPCSSQLSIGWHRPLPALFNPSVFKLLVDIPIFQKTCLTSSLSLVDIPHVCGTPLKSLFLCLDIPSL